MFNLNHSINGALTLAREYRERIHMRADIILKLSQYGELNQSQLLSYCGLNSNKHMVLVDELVEKGFVSRRTELWGVKKIILYRVTEEGYKLVREILKPYEYLFPRNEHKRRGR